MQYTLPCGKKNKFTMTAFPHVGILLLKDNENSNVMSWARGPNCLCEYETPRVVTVRHIPLGILKLVMQISVLAFVLVFQLWHAKGYQTFAQVESSVTTKVCILEANFDEIYYI